jgi:hypothetical protein
MKRVALVAAVSLALSAPTAAADAPDPVPRAIRGSVVQNTDGSRTLTVFGGTDAAIDPGWRWPTHTTDCNTDTAGAGVAVAWNDPTDTGQLLWATGAGSDLRLGVGTSADNIVHATAQLDPARGASSDITALSEWHDWRSGCGVFVEHPDAVLLPDGTTKMGPWSQGTWGPVSHTYPASVTGPLVVCPVMYGVSGTASGGPPLHRSDVTAGGPNHNTDNSLESNGLAPSVDQCISALTEGPHLSIVKEVAPASGTTYAKTLTVAAGATVSYRFTITNDGSVDLANVHVNELSAVADCVNSFAAPGDFNGTLAAGQTVIVTCRHTMGPGGLVNRASASGLYPGLADKPVEVTSATDSASVEILSAPLALAMWAPQEAYAGETVGYVLTVTSPGRSSFREPLAPADPQCNSDPIELVGKGGDLSPRSLDPGDVWVYSCSVETLSTETTIHNVARVEAIDTTGTPFTAEASSNTTLEPVAQQLVLGAQILPGSARLLGPSGCVRRPFRVAVSGTRIATVAIVLDGKLVKRASAVGSKLVAYRIFPRRLTVGVHRITARITFDKRSGMQPRTLRLSFQRCGVKLAAPRFTG